MEIIRRIDEKFLLVIEAVMMLLEQNTDFMTFGIRPGSQGDPPGRTGEKGSAGTRSGRPRGVAGYAARPASDYIRDFVQDVDRSRVLQAKDIMFTPDALLSRKSGLKMAIREMQLHGISSVFVIGSGRKLLGLITIDDAVSALKDNKTVDDILKDDYFTTGPEIYVNELIPLAKDTRYPIAVVDENERLLGIIVRASVISAFVG